MDQNIRKKTRRSKPVKALLRILFFVIIVALIVTAGIFWYWKTHKKEIIIESFQKSILEKSDSVYRVQLGDLQMDELAGHLTITNLRLSFDSLRFRTKKWEKDIPPMLVSMQMEELRITGLKSPKQLKKNKLHGNIMYIKNPLITIYYTDQDKKAGNKVPTKEEIYDELIGGMDIKLDSLVITGATIMTKDFESGKMLVEVKDLSATLEDMVINEVVRFDTSRLFFARQFHINAGKVNWSSKNKMYDYSLQKAAISSKEHKLSLGHFLVKPVMGESEFAKALPYQDDRYDFTFTDIQITDVDPEELIDENLDGDILRIGSASLKIYRDLNRPRDNKSRIGHYPHQIMNRTPFKFLLRKVLLGSTLVQYREKSNISGAITQVAFNNLNGVFNNFTNNEASVRKNNIMTADLTAGFSKLTTMKTHWTFYLMNPDGRFNISGGLGSFPGTSLNQLLGPSSPARIEEGQVNSIQFNFAGNNNSANGTVTMLYNGLKIAVMEKDKGKKEMDKKFLTSLFANMMIRNDNPKKNQPVRVVQINQPRDPNRTIFNLCWKALFTGIKESVGLKK